MGFLIRNGVQYTVHGTILWFFLSLKMLWLFHKGWSVNPVVTNRFHRSPFVPSALSFFSYSCYMVTCTEIGKDHSEGSPELPSPFPDVESGSNPCVLLDLVFCLGQSSRSGFALPFTLGPTLGPYFNLSLAQTKLSTLGAALSTGLGPSNAPNFTLTASTTGAGIFYRSKVSTSYLIKSLSSTSGQWPCMLPPPEKKKKEKKKWFSTESSWKMTIIKYNNPKSYGKNNDMYLSFKREIKTSLSGSGGLVIRKQCKKIKVLFFFFFF